MIPFLLFMVLMASLCIACPFQGGAADSLMTPKIVVDKNSSGKEIEVKVGDEIQIELESIGGTGFSWYFDVLDTTLFERVGERTRSINRERENIGGNPVIMVWILRAKTPGDSSIKMSYYRIWEGENSAIKHFEIKVHIVP